MTNDPRDFPLPDPADTAWLATFIRLLATGAVRDRPVIDVDREPTPGTDDDDAEE